MEFNDEIMEEPVPAEGQPGAEAYPPESKRERTWGRKVLVALSYVLVAAAAAFLATAITWYQIPKQDLKLAQIRSLIEEKYIGEADTAEMLDYAASALVAGSGDPWGYYISAEDLEDYNNSQNNVYVGIGITIKAREDGIGVDIVQVEPGGSAQEQGVLPGDVLIKADGQSLAGLTNSEISQHIRGEAGTAVTVTVLRQEQELAFTLERRELEIQAAEGSMLENNIGYVRIANFHSGCAEKTVEQVELLLEQGAKALVFDVRNNGGGYRHELVDLLDYLLPEGILFQSEDYTGKKSVDESDKDCLDIPMAVLVNGNTYSAAEFFAAALEEYDWAVVGGDPTSGKGYYQQLFMLYDGSAVNLSVGKYYTPNGVSLAEVGGLTPEYLVEVDAETAALIYSQALDPNEDPQVRAVTDALLEQLNG